MKEILKQFATIWRERNPLQKALFVAILLIVISLLGYLVNRPHNSFVPLFPGKTLSLTETAEICARLKAHAIPYKEDKTKGIVVSSDQVDQIRTEVGTPRTETGKGFELFDTNTWIKGEKELQVLEMRALKGQLEKDLSAFEHIKSANVILDIPPQRSFPGTKYQTKASVILNLMPGAKLSSSELRAINNHLAGAVRGLESNMIAISDTTGKLYKSIDPTGADEFLLDSSLSVEEKVTERVNELLLRLVGENHFYTTVQLSDSQMSIAIIIDRDRIPAEMPNFQKDIERQLTVCARGFGYPVQAVVDFIPFNKAKVHLIKTSYYSSFGFYLTLVFVVAALICFYPFLKSYKKSKKVTEDALLKTKTHIDLGKLGSAMRGEDPQTIAIMLSYLEPERAEELISALDSNLQDEVLFHLSEMEKRDNL